MSRAARNAKEEEDKTSLSLEDIANRQRQYTKFTQQSPRTVLSGKQNTTCYELELKKDELNKVVINQQQAMSGLYKTLTDLEKRADNISIQSSLLAVELNTVRTRMLHTEARNSELQNENEFLKDQKAVILSDCKKINSSLAKKSSDYLILAQSNTNNLAQIVTKHETIKKLESELTVETEKYRTCMLTSLKNISKCDSDIYVQYLQISASNETVNDLNSKLKECGAKTERLTAQLQNSQNDVFKARMNTENYVHEFKAAAHQSTKLIANFSEQLELYRQKLAASQLAHGETEHELKRTYQLFSNASAQSNAFKHELVISNAKRLETEVKLSTLTQQFRSLENNLTALQLTHAKTQQELTHTHQLFSNDSAQKNSCKNELVVCNTQRLEMEISMSTLSQKLQAMEKNLTVHHQLAQAKIEQELTHTHQLFSNTSAQKDMCAHELVVANTHRLEMEISLSSLSQKFRSMENNFTAHQLAQVKIKQELIHTRQLFADTSVQKDVCFHELVLANNKRLEIEVSLSTLLQKLRSIENNLTAHQLAHANIEQELTHTHQLFSDTKGQKHVCEHELVIANTKRLEMEVALSTLSQKLRVTEKNLSVVSDMSNKNAQSTQQLNGQIKEYQMNVIILKHSLSRAEQEISSCLVNLQSLATTFEITKKNFSASLNLANQHLKRSALHVQNIDKENQRAEHMLNSMREDHSKEKMILQRQIETLRGSLNSRLSNIQHCRYYLYDLILLSIN